MNPGISFRTQVIPNCGYSMMQGSLRSQGVYIQQQQIIDSIRRLDPVSQFIHRQVLTYRRKYSVAGPNALWLTLCIVANIVATKYTLHNIVYC